MAGEGRLSASPASLLDRVRGSFPAGPVVVALSGGADSAVAAWAAVELGLETRAITADHGLEASARLVEAAADIAARLSIDHQVVPAGPADGSEGGLRTVRYAAIESAARPEEAVISGHTADDQAETVLGNLIRGAGAAGLGGIPSRRGRWHRPLLMVTRDTTRAVAIELGLPFFDDPDNTDPSVRRSRIRSEVIPFLESLNPSVRDALVRAGRLAAADESVIEAAAAAVPVILRHGEVAIAAAAVATAPPAVGARAVRRALRLKLHPYPGDLGDVDAVLGLAAGEGSVSISTGLLATREGPWVVIHEAADLRPPDPIALPVPGRVTFGRWVIDSEPVTRATPSLSHRELALAGSGHLVIRTARPGETIGMAGGSKAVADALREAGVPPRLRPVWPVVEQAGRMVWVAGARVADGAAADPGEPATVLRSGESA